MRLLPCSARDASSALTSHCVSCLLVSSLPPMAPPSSSLAVHAQQARLSHSLRRHPSLQSLLGTTGCAATRRRQRPGGKAIFTHLTGSPTQVPREQGPPCQSCPFAHSPFSTTTVSSAPDDASAMHNPPTCLSTMSVPAERHRSRHAPCLNLNPPPSA